MRLHVAITIGLIGGLGAVAEKAGKQGVRSKE